MIPPKTLREASCADDYDPNSMPVDRARDLIRTFLAPVTATERVHIRQALGRVLASDVVSPLAVPGHDNSAMDGYAVRFADLSPDRETTLARVGESFAGKPGGVIVGPGQCVRIFTGGVMPEGADSVVMQERANEDAGGVRIGIKDAAALAAAVKDIVTDVERAHPDARIDGVLACEMVSEDPPVFVSVSDWLPVLPTCTLPKAMLAGFALTVPA